MFAILAGLFGLGAFLLGEAWGAGTGLLVLFLIEIGMAVCVVIGAFVGARKPALARWLMGAWTPALLLGLGLIGALGIEFAIQLTPGESASDRTKALYGAGGAVVVAIVAAVNGWVATHRAPWLGRRVICWRYGPYFPCLPEGDSPGRRAKEALTPICGSASAPLSSGAQVQALLQVIKAALDVGEFQGGANWSC